MTYLEDDDGGFEIEYLSFNKESLSFNKESAAFKEISIMFGLKGIDVDMGEVVEGE